MESQYYDPYAPTNMPHIGGGTVGEFVNVEGMNMMASRPNTYGAMETQERLYAQQRRKQELLGRSKAANMALYENIREGFGPTEANSGMFMVVLLFLIFCVLVKISVDVKIYGEILKNNLRG